MKELLANFRIHVDITPEEANRFIELAPPTTVKKNAYIVRQKEQASPLILVNNGCLMTYYQDPNKNKQVMQFSQMGWWTGDFLSIAENTLSKYSIRAMENSSYCSLDNATYERVCAEIPILETYFRRLFQNAIASHQERIIRNISFSAEERYETFIKSYPKIEQMVAQKYIASYLGMSPEFLSKIKARRYANKR
ncbi:cAMP-binding domain of CRP or a regulatory subunit of cAMP-dependent protein kinases [Spirosomataceae bacterium TFI 002]|nr:cAMP-binding domain of CRP or a regulatory subunit of cAMP-dependent protein kinases [Spirosomataceae bacterium TFI 002]